MAKIATQDFFFFVSLQSEKDENGNSETLNCDAVAKVLHAFCGGSFVFPRSVYSFPSCGIAVVTGFPLNSTR